MRVIAGSARGVRLAPVPAGVRPVADRAREGLFSSLGSAVVDAEVLDLYAGTGALGIEALSRGAAKTTFVERSRTALATLRVNLSRARLADRAAVMASDVSRFLMRNGKSHGDRYDLALADPPYEAAPAEVDSVLAALDAGWLRPGWTVVLTRRRGSSTPVIPVHWRLARRLEYGDTAVLIFREA
ncbi:MAG TPA: 16S rRNA (guanine(966)-N(2))-methyltransferase RsmD [Actinomycetota bacterium]|nr:16S rRNA (guanine(966)-N(2))-methyltransferase RsmD [Actinomycetota bacterium]